MDVAWNSVFTPIATETDDTASISYAPGTTIAGIFVTIYTPTHGDDRITSVTFGGDALTRIVEAHDTVDEPGSAYLYFVGTSIPSGTQNVVITVNAAATQLRGVIGSVTAAADTSIIDSDLISGNVGNPQLTLATGADNAAVTAGIYSGLASVASLTELSGQTQIQSDDFGSHVTVSTRRTAIEAGNITIGWTASSDDTAMVALAIIETAAAGGNAKRYLMDDASIDLIYQIHALPVLEIGTGNTGTGASTLDGVTSAGSGTYTPPPITGTGASTLAGVTSAGSGTYTPAPITGSGSVTLDNVTSTGSGTFIAAITGTGASTLDGVTSAGSGTHTPPAITGTGASTLEGVTSAGSGTSSIPDITGTGASTLDGVTSSGSGTYTPAPITGTGNITLDGVTSAGVGSLGVNGAGASTLDGVASAGTGTFTPEPVTGSGSTFLEDVTSVGVGFFAEQDQYFGSGTILLEGVTSEGEGTIVNPPGDGEPVLRHPLNFAINVPPRPRARSTSRRVGGR